MTPNSGPALDEYRLYRAYGDDWTLLYIGQTGRVAAKRWQEHMADQPWAGEVAQWVRDPRVWRTLDDVLEVERAAIDQEGPLYNYMHNLRNPHRVPVQRRPRPSGRVSISQSSRRRRRWTRRKVAAVAWTGLWLVSTLAAVGWFWLGVHLRFGDAAMVGAAGSTGLLLFSRYQARPRRSRRRSRW